MITTGFATAQPGSWTSGQFGEMMRLASGDGVCDWGGQFAGQLSGMTVTLGNGFGLIGGHWLKSDSPETVSFPPASIQVDRVDAVAIWVDEKARQASLGVLAGIDPAGIRDGTLDTADGPALVLYTSLIRRGAQSAGELTDCRRMVPLLPSVTEKVLRAYDFTFSGIDREVARLLALGQAVSDKADAAIARLDKTLQAAGRAPAVGELSTARFYPGIGWLLCDGGAVPPEYPALAALTGPNLPDIPPPAPRLSTWIFAGNLDGEEGSRE